MGEFRDRFAIVDSLFEYVNENPAGELSLVDSSRSRDRRRIYSMRRAPGQSSVASMVC